MSFELLDHPADVGFRTFAPTLPDLYVESAHALVSLILDPSAIRPELQVGVTAEGTDFESLLVNWLNEVLYLTDSKRLALGFFEVKRLDECAIKCVARGEPRDPQRHRAKLVVKAVTYHQLQIVKTPEGWSADVYVDV